MSALIELIKRIGIFMIAAQAVLHFTPGQKYEKYIKLIVGMMVLLQFVTTLRDNFPSPRRLSLEPVPERLSLLWYFLFKNITCSFQT